MKQFGNVVVLDLGFGHIRKAGLVGTEVGHQGFHLHARLCFCVDHGLHCNQARMADRGHACNRSQFDGCHGGDYSAILDEAMHCTDAHDAKPRQAGSMTYTRAIAAVIDWLNKRLPKPANRMPYTGEWKDNKQHGQGTRTYSNGGTYTAEWKDGMQHGQGTWTYPDGDTYTGEWKNGMQHGQGTWTYPDGRTITSAWQYGEPVT